MKTVRTRKFAWVALVFAMVLVAGPVVTQPGTTPLFPFQCPPIC